MSTAAGICWSHSMFALGDAGGTMIISTNNLPASTSSELPQGTTNDGCKKHAFAHQWKPVWLA